MTTSDENDDDSGSSPWVWIWLAIGIVLVVRVTVAIPVVAWWFGALPDSAGEFGDMFGVANALFTGLAFALVIATMMLQRQELKLQRRELRQARVQYKRQADSFDIQNQLMEHQRFETTFFNLLSRLSRISERSFDKAPVDEPIFENTLEDIPGMESSVTVSSCRSRIEVFETAYAERIYLFGHYFRALYHLVRFIDNSVVHNKQFYADQLRAQLSNDELILLSANCASKYGRQKFKPLVESYGLLENMIWEGTIADDFKREYTSSAFGKGEEAQVSR